MYSQLIPIWLRGQALTADRLNKTVNAVNYLLNLAADAEASPGTSINVAPPGGDTPPTPNFQNPPVDEIDALGQPFRFFNSAAQVIPPTVCTASSASAPAPSLTGTAYFTTVTTDRFGNPTAVATNTTAPNPQLWNGSLGGALSVCTGYLAQNDFGEYFSVDANPFFLPIVPVSLPGSADSVSLVQAPIGNSVPIARLRPGAGTTLTSSTSADGALEITIASGGLSGVTYNATLTAPAIINGVLNLNFASTGYPGAISSLTITPSATAPTLSAGVADIPGANYDPSDPSVGNPGAIVSLEVTTYDPSDPSAIYTSTPKITAGHAKIPVPAAISQLENVTAQYGFSAEPGYDGWVQTLYLNGTYQNGALQYVRNDRQLMRIVGSTLQIVNQEQLPDSSSPSWHPSPYA